MDRKVELAKMKQRREGWKEWFVLEPPKNTDKFYVWFAGGSFKFEVDPSFDAFDLRFEVRGIEPQSVLTYMFESEKIIQKTVCFAQIIDLDSNLRAIDITIRK